MREQPRERSYARFHDALDNAHRYADIWGEVAYVSPTAFHDGEKWCQGYDVVNGAELAARGLAPWQAFEAILPTDTACRCGSNLPIGDDGVCLVCALGSVA